jgi:hypothetical protein
MRRGDATISVRQDTRFVDAQQTRVAKRKVPGSSDGEPPPEGGKHHHNLD